MQKGAFWGVRDIINWPKVVQADRDRRIANFYYGNFGWGGSHPVLCTDPAIEIIESGLTCRSAWGARSEKALVVAVDDEYLVKLGVGNRVCN